ncbi:MAG TPA: CHAT domain-containing protein, partial [Thermoanaerobaculia bacterium]|nr:CHAT domain-containing protein [Thermoanaerobaculia bacterium]
LLELVLGDERSFAWTIGDRGVRSFVLPPGRELERSARRLFESASAAGAVAVPSPRDSGEELARVLLAPAWSEARRASRLVVVPDGALELVPWSALPVPPAGGSWSSPLRVPFIERAEVVEIPSATSLALTRRRRAERPTAARWAAVFADPVFDAEDLRVRSAQRLRVPATLPPARSPEPPAGGRPRGLERLPATRREAAAIASLAPPGQVFAALDFAANREAVLSADLSRYRVVHFATHAVADTRNPELSGLVLSQVDATGSPRAGFLRVPDVEDLELAADLVVLSGCQTALGKEIRGEGLLGLTRAFAAAGVPRVLGSLWRVEDRATAEVMTRLYRAMWRHGATAAAALRTAQQAVRRDPRYRAPHYWAAFVHQGDWR